MSALLLPEVRSELVRTAAAVLLGWLGLTAVLAVLVNSVMFGVVVDNPQAAADGPGVAFPTLAQLQSAEGLTAGLGAASNLLGVVTLAFCALLTATDYSSGLVRLLVSAQPRRWRLVAGKAIVLAGWTAVSTTVALVACVVAVPAAQAAGVSTDTWSGAGAGVLASAWVDLLLSLLVWAVIGLVLGVVTRSAAIAVSIGAGWVLLLEGIIGSALGDVADRLPGATLTALAQGGTAAVSYGSALALGAAYVAVGLVLALLVTARRDVTD